MAGFHLPATGRFCPPADSSHDNRLQACGPFEQVLEIGVVLELRGRRPRIGIAAGASADMDLLQCNVLTFR